MINWFLLGIFLPKGRAGYFSSAFFGVCWEFLGGPGQYFNFFYLPAAVFQKERYLPAHCTVNQAASRESNFFLLSVPFLSTQQVEIATLLQSVLVWLRLKSLRIPRFPTSKGTSEELHCFQLHISQPQSF